MSVPGVKRPNESQFIADEPQRKKQKQKHDLPFKQDFPFPKGWTAEWAGEKGRNFVYTAVANSTTLTHAHGPVSVVVQYLRKTDILGLADLERIAGGKEKLAQLLPGYHPEKPIPDEVEDILQGDLAALFTKKQIRDKHVLEPFAHVGRVSELFSIYWCPKGTTGQIIEDIAKLHGEYFLGGDVSEQRVQQQMQDHWNIPTSEDRWILFPNGVFRCNLKRRRGTQKIEWAAPRGFELPHVQEAIFCAFMKYISTRQTVPTRTYCQEKSWYYRPWIVGPYLDINARRVGDKGLHISDYQVWHHGGEFIDGGAFMRRFV